MHVPLPDLELLGLGLVVVQQVYRERAPLRRRRVKVPVLDVQIARGHRLRAQPVEEGHLRPAGDAQVGVLQRLLLLGRLRNNFDALAVEHADVVSRPVEHLHRQHEVLPLVGVGYVQSFGGAVLFAVVEVQLLHVVVGVPYADEGAELGRLIGVSVPEHLFVAETPPFAEEIDAGGRAEEAFFVAVGLLGDLRVEDHHDHVGAVPEVALHGVAGEAAVVAGAEGHERALDGAPGRRARPVPVRH